jgi:AcrR family transcriptional regulator
MGIAERREREKEQRKNLIVEAAERIIFSKGYDDATLDDIAEKAELSKGTLYLYFKNKEELYLAVLLRGFDILHGMFQEAVRQNVKGIERLLAIGRAYIRFYHEHHHYFINLLFFENRHLMLDKQNRYEKECVEKVNAIFNILITAVQAGIDDGTVREDIDPIKTALLLWAQTNGVLQTLVMKKEIIDEFFQLDPQELVAYYFEQTASLMRPL